MTALRAARGRPGFHRRRPDSAAPRADMGYIYTVLLFVSRVTSPVLAWRTSAVAPACRCGR